MTMALLSPGMSDKSSGNGASGELDRSGQPSLTEIRAALERILATEAFVKSKRRGPLLRYLVEKAISGRAADLNEYAIGLDVFRKASSYDPRIDPIVRAEIGRLRRRLKKYYDTDGVQDSVCLELPNRSYQLRFVFREAPPVRRSRRLWWAAAAALVCVSIAVAGWTRYVGRHAAEVIYESGFEPPVYGLGQLNRYDSWAVDPAAAVGAVTVQSNTAFGKGQAVRFAATGVPKSARAMRLVTFSNKVDHETAISIALDTQLSASGSPSQWELVSAFDRDRFIAFLGVKASGELFVRRYGGVIFHTGVLLTRGLWNHVAMDINFRTNSVSAYLNGKKIVSDFALAGPGIANLRWAGFEMGAETVGTDTAYFDNFSIRTLP